jgi:hypothetical protein
MRHSQEMAIVTTGLTTGRAAASAPKGMHVRTTQLPSPGGAAPEKLQDLMLEAGSMSFNISSIASYNVKECRPPVNNGGPFTLAVEIWSTHNTSQSPTWTLYGGAAAGFLAAVGSPLFDRSRGVIDPSVYDEQIRQCEALLDVGRGRVQVGG